MVAEQRNTQKLPPSWLHVAFVHCIHKAGPVALFADVVNLLQKAAVVHVLLPSNAHPEQIHEGIDGSLWRAIAHAEIRQHALKLGARHCADKSKRRSA